MVTIREITLGWVTPSGAGKASVLNFSAAGAPPGTQRGALATLLGVLTANLVPATQVIIPTEGREFDMETGALTGAWTAGSPIVINGGAAGQPVADASQVLLRWKTGIIREGRFLQGRTFVPGLNNGYTAAGNVTGSLVTTWQAAMSTFLGASTGFGVWGRPIHRGDAPDSAGQFQAASAGTVWPEIAVLRRRRG